MISSCCTLRLKRRNALSKVSPSWTRTSAKLDSPPVLVKSRGHSTLGLADIVARLEGRRLPRRTYLRGFFVVEARSCKNVWRRRRSSSPCLIMSLMPERSAAIRTLRSASFARIFSTSILTSGSEPATQHPRVRNKGAIESPLLASKCIRHLWHARQ